MSSHNTLEIFQTNTLVDFHVHVFEHHGHPDFNLNPDTVGIENKIPVIVDQGGPGALTLASFKHNIVEKSETTVQCFVSPYMIGGNPRGELSEIFGPRGMNADKTVEAVMKVDPDLTFVCGVKAHCGPSNYDYWGIEPLIVAEQIANRLGLPLYLHLGSLHNFNDSKVDSTVILGKVLDLLRPGDVLAHPYRPENGIVRSDGSIHPLFKSFKEKGVLIDVGRGTKFSYHVARTLISHGYLPDIISSDLHGYTYGKSSLLQAMDEMLYFGVGLDHILQSVTDIPSSYLRTTTRKTSKIVLSDRSKVYKDSMGESITVDRSFELI